MFRFLLLSVIAVIALLADINFDTIEISANELKNGEKSFLNPGALSSRQNLKSQNKSIDSIVRSLPGSYTQVDEAQGSVSVNIRGLTGLGRVNTMVDGVTQTYYGTSSDSGGFHAFTGNLATQAFGAIIDQNFLKSVDIERGFFHGADNSLVGSANFRTIGVDDVVSSNKNFGFLGRYSYGTNGVGFNYMGSVAAKTELKNGSNIGFLMGYSTKRITQDYKDGSGKKTKESYTDVNGDGIPDLANALDVDNLTQRPKNILMKLEYSNEDHKAIFSHRKHSNYLAKRKIDSLGYQLDYNYNPISDFVNLSVIASHVDTEQIYDKDATIGWGTLANGMTFKNKASSFDINNALKFDMFDSKILSILGINVLKNDYRRITGDKDYATLTTNYIVPEGKQDITTIYLDNNLEYGIFDFDINTNLMKWQLSGKKGKCSQDNTYCQPKEAGVLKRSDTELNYSLMASAKLHEYFMPFISYSKNTRALNVQELFHSGTASEDINTLLKPESSKTFQIGFNSHKHGVFSDNDVFGFKATYYRSKIKDFIYDKLLLHGDFFLLRLNDEARLKGLELELMYDAGFFYTTASYARQSMKYPISNSFGLDWSNGPASGISQFSELPKYYANIDAGVRLLNEKLTIGGVATITGKAKRFNPLFEYGDMETQFKKVKTQDLPRIPAIFDFYATYEPVNSLTIKFEVQNVFDKNYMNALYTYNSSYSNQVFNDSITIFNNQARGRTMLLSLEYRY